MTLTAVTERKRDQLYTKITKSMNMYGTSRAIATSHDDSDILSLHAMQTLQSDKSLKRV